MKHFPSFLLFSFFQTVAWTWYIIQLVLKKNPKQCYNVNNGQSSKQLLVPDNDKTLLFGNLRSSPSNRKFRKDIYTLGPTMLKQNSNLTVIEAAVELGVTRTSLKLKITHNHAQSRRISDHGHACKQDQRWHQSQSNYSPSSPVVFFIV